MTDEAAAPQATDTTTSPEAQAPDAVPQSKQDAAPTETKVPTREEVKQKLADLRAGKQPDAPKLDAPVPAENEPGPSSEPGSDEEGEDDGGEALLYHKAKNGTLIPKGKGMPKGVYNKEREARIAAEKRAEERDALLVNERAERAREKQSIEALLALAGKGPEKGKAEDFEPWDAEADKKYSSAFEELKNEIKELKSAGAVSNYIQTAMNERQSFAKENPDYPEALNHLFRVKHAEAMYLAGGDSIEAGKLAQMELSKVMAAAYQRKMNTAEVAYKLAVAAGYAKKAPKAEGPNLNKIDENKKKSAGLDGIRGESVQLDSGNSKVTQTSFEKNFVKKDDKGRVIGIDRAKLAEARQAIRSRQMSGAA